MTACARSCTIRYRHLTACRVPDGDSEVTIEITADHPAAAGLFADPDPTFPKNLGPDLVLGDHGLEWMFTCYGCKPREAQHGLLCSTCHRRLQEWLSGEHGLVWTYGWLGENLPAGGARAQQEWQRPSKVIGSPAPLSVAIHDLRVLLMDRVIEVEDCARDVFDRPTRDTFDLRSACAFLSAWLTKIEQDEDLVQHMYELFYEVMRDAACVAPWRDRPKVLDGVPCPHCDRMSLVIYGGSSDVECRTCRGVFPRDQYDRWTALLAYEAREAS